MAAGTRAAELGVDVGRIVAWGESAGGHQAALLGLGADQTDLTGFIPAAQSSQLTDALAAAGVESSSPPHWASPTTAGSIKALATRTTVVHSMPSSVNPR